jgi:FkbM family methyltransferase
MKKFLLDSGIEFDGNFIKIPNWCKRVRIDVGLSSNAPQSQKWLEYSDDLIVFAFEPLLSNINSIKSESSSWPVKLNSKLINKKIFLIPCALGKKRSRSKVPFFVTSNDPGCSSLLKPKKFELDRVEMVSQWTLSDFLKFIPFELINNGCIEYLKTDCQGTDADIILGASNYLNNIAVITCEAENGQYFGSSNDLKRIRKILNKYNFTYVNWLRRLSPWYKNIKTDDPTFINKKYRQYIIGNKNEFYQFG